jgi:hypothetical protein
LITTPPLLSKIAGFDAHQVSQICWRYIRLGVAYLE